MQFAWLGKDSKGRRIATGHLRMPTGYHKFLDVQPEGPRRSRSAGSQRPTSALKKQLDEDVAWQQALAKLEANHRAARDGGERELREIEMKMRVRAESARLAAKSSHVIEYVRRDDGFPPALAKLEGNHKVVERARQSGRQKKIKDTFRFLSSLGARSEKRLAWIQKESHEVKVKKFAREMIGRLAQTTRDSIFKRYYAFIKALAPLCVNYADSGSIPAAIMQHTLQFTCKLTPEDIKDFMNGLYATQSSSSDQIVVTWLLVVLGELAPYVKDDENGYHRDVDIVGNLIQARSVVRVGTVPRTTTKAGKENYAKSFKEVMTILMNQQKSTMEREAREADLAEEAAASDAASKGTVGTQTSVSVARERNRRLAVLVRMSRAFDRVNLLLDGANKLYEEMSKSGEDKPTALVAPQVATNEGETVVRLDEAIGPA